MWVGVEVLSTRTVASLVREYGFELTVAAALERAGLPGSPGVEAGGFLARQLGTSVRAAGSRIMDLVYVAPGPTFEERVKLSPRTIPPRAIESDVSVGSWTPAASAVEAPPEVATEIVDTAVSAGFFERRRRGGRTVIRRATRYPDSWFCGLLGIENKPDLARPGDLLAQLRRDRSLQVLDRLVVLTASHVTRAHRNRLPGSVGIWRFDPDDGQFEAIRDPAPLDSAAASFEIRAERPGRFDVMPVEPAAKARQRRRIAERAYGKGWRTFELPGCAKASPRTIAGTDGLPGCEWAGRLVEPNAECSTACPGYDPARPPSIDLDAERERRTPWDADPPGAAREQASLSAFR